MKKTFVLLLSLLLFAACDKEEEKTKPQFSHPVEEEESAVVEKLYAVSMRREVPFPFSAYVLRLSDGRDVYCSATVTTGICTKGEKNPLPRIFFLSG